MTRFEWLYQGVWEDITDSVANVEIRQVSAWAGANAGPDTATFNFRNGSSYFTTDMAAFKADYRNRVVLAVKVEVPDGPWQRLKWRLKRVRGFGWVPVRTRWETRFRGVVEPNPVGWVKP